MCRKVEAKDLGDAQTLTPRQYHLPYQFVLLEATSSPKVLLKESMCIKQYKADERGGPQVAKFLHSDSSGPHRAVLVSGAEKKTN